MAAGVFLAIWASMLLAASEALSLLALIFPILMVADLYALGWLRGWKQRLLGLLCCVVLWPATFVLGMWMLFLITPP
jgi:hypothetical protein